MSARRRGAQGCLLAAVGVLAIAASQASAAPAVRSRPAADTLAVGSDEPLRLRDAGAIARVRRAAGDMRLRPWRVTPSRFETYLAGVRALGRDVPAAAFRAGFRAIDPDYNAALRPWDAGGRPLRPGEPDAARLLADAIHARPAFAASLRPYVPVEQWAATQMKLTVCARALSYFVSFGETPGGREIRAWLARQRPRPGPEADFAESLIMLTEGAARMNAAFAAQPAPRVAAPPLPFRPAKP